MRRNIIGRRIPNPISNSASKSSFLLSSYPFSTSSGRGGGGRGRGRSFVEDKFDSDARAPGKPQYEESKRVSPEPQRNGIGRGGGGGDFSAFISALRTSKPGVGRGRGTDEQPGSQRPQPQSVANQTQFEQNRPFRGQPYQQPQSVPNQTQFEQNRPFRGQSHQQPQPVRNQTQFADSTEENLQFRGLPRQQSQSVPNQTQFAQSSEQNLQFRGPPHQQPQSVPNQTQSEQNLLPRINLQPSGVGRGRSEMPPPLPQPTPRLTEENRHVRSPGPRPRPGGEQAEARVEQPKLSREDAVKRAVSILSKGDGEGAGGRSGGPGGGGRGRGEFQRRGRFDDDHDESYGGLDTGDDADGERLAERLSVENMQKLMEGFEEMSDRILPSPEQDAYVDAMHTNYAIEFEPEYLMGEFDQNPDIDEKPPMPLRDMLEKVKPFILAYEGIQSQEEWEEVVEETMKRVPLLKEIVDYYSGPDRVTAKKQNEELERVAKLIPPNAPASVKQFTDRAVLSLQSNPGWGFDKKCQYMDKLVREVNQCYP